MPVITVTLLPGYPPETQHRLVWCGLAQSAHTAKHGHQCVGPQVAWINHPLLQLRRAVALRHPIQ